MILLDYRKKYHDSTINCKVWACVHIWAFQMSDMSGPFIIRVKTSLIVCCRCINFTNKKLRWFESRVSSSLWLVNHFVFLEKKFIQLAVWLTCLKMLSTGAETYKSISIGAHKLTKLSSHGDDAIPNNIVRVFCNFVFRILYILSVRGVQANKSIHHVEQIPFPPKRIRSVSEIGFNNGSYFEPPFF